jgi:hypothetical protein
LGENRILNYYDNASVKIVLSFKRNELQFFTRQIGYPFIRMSIGN